MREIDEAIKNGNERAKLTLKMYERRITKYIGAYAAEMGGVDIIVFTGGVGENQQATRYNVWCNARLYGRGNRSCRECQSQRK